MNKKYQTVDGVFNHIFSTNAASAMSDQCNKHKERKLPTVKNKKNYHHFELSRRRGLK